MKFLAVLFVLCLSFGLTGQAVSAGETSFNADLNLQHDIATLSRLVSRPGDAAIADLRGQTFFLNASLGALIASSTDPYFQIFELLAGEWQANGTLVLHRVYLQIDDPALGRYFDRAEGRQFQLFANLPELAKDASGRPMLLLRLRTLIIR